MTPIETVLAFMDRINQRDPDQLAELGRRHSSLASLFASLRGRAWPSESVNQFLLLRSVGLQPVEG